MPQNLEKDIFDVIIKQKGVSDMDDQTNAKIAHLGMIQGIISRFASTSLAIKGFSAALVTTALLVTGDFDYKLVIALAIVTFFLSIFDAQYLKLEREYRLLYNEVADKKDAIDFSMKTNEKVCLFKAYKSWSVWFFYLIIAIAPLIFWLVK